MHHLTLSAIVLTTFAIPSYGQDAVGLPADATCQTVIDSELERGAELQKKPQPADPALQDLYGTQVFKRTQNGSEAAVIYLCGGFKRSGGTVDTQLIYIYLESESAAVAEYVRQRRLLDQQLGKPCWDPAQVQENRFGPRVVWNVRSKVQTDLTWSKVVNRQPLHWVVIIATHAPTDMELADESLRTVYAKSTCELPKKGESSVVPPNKSPERAREG